MPNLKSDTLVNNNKSSASWLKTAAFGGTMLLLLTACGGSDSAPTGSSAPSVPGGVARVTYTQPNKTIEFKHLRAVRFEGNDGKTEIRLFFSSLPMDTVVVTDYFGADQVREWAIPAGITDVADVKAILDLRVPGNSPESGYNGMIYPNKSISTAGKSAFKTLKIGQDNISGSLDLGNAFGGNSDWQINGNFDAPLTTVKQVTPLSGPDISDLPQLRQLSQLMAALEVGKLDGVKKLLTEAAAAQIEEYTGNMDEEEIKELLAGIRSGSGELKDDIASGTAQLYLAGDRAQLVIENKAQGSSSKVTYSFQWQRGNWMIDL